MIIPPPAQNPNLNLTTVYILDQRSVTFNTYRASWVDFLPTKTQ